MKNIPNIQKLIMSVFFLSVFSLIAAEMQRNIPISFYGQVVDQHQEPVKDALVTIDIATDPTGNNLPRAGRHNLKTDQNGKFTLTEILGYSLHIMGIEKSGYELSNKAKRGYPYLMSSDIHHPDSNNPVVFKMWQQAGKEPLANSSWHGKVFGDGRTNSFDLSAGKLDANGSLQIICSKILTNDISKTNSYFIYQLSCKIINGGIQAFDSEFSYLAPEMGYVPSFVVSKRSDSPSWKGNIKQEFYFKTADGKFGVLSLDWYAWQTPPVHFEWNCSVNPSGSRNLER